MIGSMMIRRVCCIVMAEFWATKSVMSARVSYPRLVSVNHAALGLVMGRGVRERGFMRDFIFG